MERARFLVVPDSFKGTLTAAEAASAIARGVESAGATAVPMPAADGGEGTADALIRGLGGELRRAPAHDPLGRRIEASWAALGDGSTAAVEVASASGIGLVDEDERDAEAASTRGTGELVAAAIAAGARRVLVAAGGSATTDGGAGAIEAIEAAGGLRGAALEVLCDVSVPFESAAELFAPQKGADEAAVARLARRLVAQAGAFPRDPRGRAMTGAAGGLAGGLWAALGARLVPGAAYVLGVLGFERELERADAAIAGEGCLDARSFEGKLVGEVAKRCREAGVPLHAIAGRLEVATGEAARRGIASVRTASTPGEIEAVAEAIAAQAIAGPSASG